MNRVGIAIRKDKDTFRDFNDVLMDLSKAWNSGKLNDLDKADITKSLAGTRQRETLLVLLDNMNEVNRLNQAIANSAGSAESKFNDAYGKSTEAKMNVLKNSTQKLYMTMFNSDTINSAVSGLTNFINGLNTIISSSNSSKVALVGLTASVIALSIAIKQVGVDSLNTAIINFIPNLIKFVTSGQLLTKVLEGVKGAFSFLLSPVGLIATALSIATVAVVNHIQHQKELKKELEANTDSYKNLSQSMKELDFTTQKTESDKLAKQQAQLQDLLKTRDSLSGKKASLDFESNKSEYNRVASDLGKVDTKIKELTQTLKEAGFTVDETTGKVMELEVAQNNINIDEQIQKIKSDTEAKIKNAEVTTQLIDRYLSLANAGSLTKEQQQEMSIVARQLANNIKGLTIVTDANGNAMIQNVNVLETKKIALSDVANSAVTSANAQIDADSKLLKVVVDNTAMTLESLQQRVEGYKTIIQAYQADMNALASSGREHGSFALTQKDLEAFQNLEKYESILNSIKSKIGGLKYGYNNNTGSGVSSSNSSYIPPNTSSSTEDPTKKLISDEKAKIDAITKLYESSKTKIENQIGDIELQIRLTSEDNKETIAKLNEEKLKLQNTLLSDSEDYLKQLGTVTVTTAEAQDQLANSVENATDSIRSLKGEIADINKTLENTAKDGIKDYIDSMKQIDEMALEQKHKNEKDNLEKSIYGTTKAEWEKANQTKIDAIDAQIDSINKVADAQDEITQRIEKQNNLIKLQTELENIKNEKNIKILQTDANGNSKFVLTYDEKAYKDKQDELNNATKDYSKWESDMANKHLIEGLNNQKTYYEKLAKNKEESYNTQLSDLEKAQKTEYDTLELHYKDIDTLTETYLSSLVKKFGSNWGEIVKDITSKVGQAKALVQTLLEAQTKAGSINITENPLAPVISTDKVEIKVESNGTSDWRDLLNGNLEHDRAIISSNISKFDTGGNTGTFSGGKLAVLHQKEQVLDAEQTKGWLKLVDYLPKIMPILNNFKIPEIPKFNLANSINSGSTNKYEFNISQVVTPNVDNFVSQMKNLCAMG